MTPFKIVKDFASLGFNSIMLGTLFALLSSLILKNFRVFSQNPISETMLIFCFGYLSYVISEVSQYSGIITLLTSGVVMAHYTWYNLSPQGKQSSFIVFQFLGYVIEAFVFSYLGLTFFSYGSFKWSPELFAIELGIIILGRGLGTFGLIGLLGCCGYKSGISLKELTFIWYAGMIRGAIAFGLVLRIDPHEYANRDVIVTTSLALVVFTTVVFGSTVGIIQKCLFSNQGEDNNTGAITVVQADQNEKPEEDGFSSVDLSNSDSEYERMMHPNEENNNVKVSQHIHGGFVKYLHRFDELIMKPIFIYKYEKSMQKKSEEFFNLFMKQGDEIENEFLDVQKKEKQQEQSLFKEEGQDNIVEQKVGTMRRSLTANLSSIMGKKQAQSKRVFRKQSDDGSVIFKVSNYPRLSNVQEQFNETDEQNETQKTEEEEQKEK